MLNKVAEHHQWLDSTCSWDTHPGQAWGGWAGQAGGKALFQPLSKALPAPFLTASEPSPGGLGCEKPCLASPIPGLLCLPHLLSSSLPWPHLVCRRGKCSPPGMLPLWISTWVSFLLFHMKYRKGSQLRVLPQEEGGRDPPKSPKKDRDREGLARGLAQPDPSNGVDAGRQAEKSSCQEAPVRAGPWPVPLQNGRRKSNPYQELINE